MADRVSKEKRSEIMSKIRGKNTGPERRLREAFEKAGVTGFKEQERVHKTRPDFIFEEIKVAIFIDGCFWHACPKHYRVPKSNVEFWTEKVRKNVERDKRNNDTLRAEGWVVVRSWECEGVETVVNTVELLLD